jgi:hypothetical protein
MNQLNGLFGKSLKVVNIGITTFQETLINQNITNVHLDWRPPAGGDLKLIEILSKLDQQKIKKCK